MMNLIALFIAIGSQYLLLTAAYQNDSVTYEYCRTEDKSHHLICNGYIKTFIPSSILTVTIQNIREWQQTSAIYLWWESVTSVRVENCSFGGDKFPVIQMHGEIRRLEFKDCRFSALHSYVIRLDFKVIPLHIDEIIVRDSFLDSSFQTTILLLPQTTKLSLINMSCVDRMGIMKYFFVGSENMKKSFNIVRSKCPILINPFNYRYVNYTASEDSVVMFLMWFNPHRGLPEHVSRKDKIELDRVSNLSQLISIDISHNYISPEKIPITLINPSSRVYCSALQEFYARNIFSFSCAVYLQKYRFRSCVQFKFLERFFDSYIVCLDPENISILDLAGNKITSIDDSFVNALTALKIFDISLNDIHTMNEGSSLGFKQMSNLEVLYVANNQIRTLPVDIFINQQNLSIIDLSNNRLDSIMFKIDNLMKLKVLRLDDNDIIYLDESLLTQLNRLITRQRVFPNVTFKLGLSGNPLNASACLIKPFITWVLNNNSTMISWPLYRNQSGVLTIIDRATLQTVSELCRWPIYIIIACILSTVTLSIVIACAIYSYIHLKNIRKEKNIRNLIRNVKNAYDRQRFPVFLSFCSEDADFVMDNVFEELNNRLQILLETRQRRVAMGDADFRPGLMVVEEMVRCLSICDVVILCVSNKFLKSPWCADETRIAHYLRKPVMLMFLEEVDMKLLRKSVLFLYFMTSCRTKWVLKPNGGYELQPAWQILCETLLFLMSKARNGEPEEEEETVV